MVKFKVEEFKSFSLVEFEIEGGVIEPSALAQLEPPIVDTTKGVILSGRGPVWLYGFLIHFYHPTAFVATYDPRLGGGVVVESHHPGVKVGDIFKVMKK